MRGVYDHLYLDIYPPSLHAPGSDLPGARQLLRPVAYAGAASEDVRTDVSDRTGRPLVYLTFGTVFHDSDAFRVALIGIQDLGVGLVATVGPGGDPTLFGSQPPRVVIERYIPQTALLPLCDVVASHAGSGTVLGALALGIPQLCLPQAADQFLNAEAVADAVGRLHDDTRFRAQARRVADEIASMPSPDAVAPVFEALV